MGISFYLTARQHTSTMNKLTTTILMLTIAAMTASGHQYGIDVNQDGRIDRLEYHWAFPDQDLYEEFGKLDHNNDGFIDAAEEERSMRVRDVMSAVGKNIELLEQLDKAQLTEQQAELIFGDESRGGCSVFEGLGCTAALSGSILACVPETLTGVGLAVCVAGLVGATSGCMPCVCWVANHIGVKC